MLEIEVKAHADSLERLRAQLKDMGAEYVDNVVDEDCYYAHPQRDFAVTDEALRVRVNGAKTYLTYKGPKLDTTTKTREEYEVVLDSGSDAATLKTLLEKLGFVCVATVTKNRDIYNYDGYGITLDDVPGLGLFAEVEARKPGDTDTLRDGVISLIHTLGLTKTERRSYLELLLEQGKK